MAIRDSERRAEASGVDNYRTKLVVYLVAARSAPAWPARLIFLQKLRISPDAAFSVKTGRRS